MTATASNTCMKCGGRMRPYERSGLLIDQCEDCRAMFLDQGELERLIDAEGGGWSGRVGAPSTTGDGLGDPSDARRATARPASGEVSTSGRRLSPAQPARRQSEHARAWGEPIALARGPRRRV